MEPAESLVAGGVSAVHVRTARGKQRFLRNGGVAQIGVGGRIEAPASIGAVPWDGIAASIPITATTTRSSISVKPRLSESAANWFTMESCGLLQLALRFSASKFSWCRRGGATLVPFRCHHGHFARGSRDSESDKCWRACVDVATRYRTMGLRWSASRRARATIVSVGAPAPAVGKTELPAMNRLALPCTRHCGSTTPWRGSALMRVVPM